MKTVFGSEEDENQLRMGPVLVLLVFDRRKPILIGKITVQCIKILLYAARIITSEGALVFFCGVSRMLIVD